jgi:hypothetical protein
MRSGLVLPSLILTVAAFALADQFQQRRRMAVRWLALSSVALVAAVTCRQLDVAQRFSGPDAWLQGSAMMAPCSVKAAGRYLIFCPLFKVTICDLERRMSSASANVNRNMKSTGNLSALRLTAWLSAFVGTP